MTHKAQHAILRFAKHKAGPAGALEAHHERTKERYASNPDIDISKSKDNFHIIQPAQKYRKEINIRIKTAGCRLRKDSTMFVDTLITASPEFFTGRSKQEVQAYFTEAVAFMEKKVGGGNIFSAVVHMDEKTPHLHATIVPIVTTERLRKKREGEKKYETKSGARLSVQTSIRCYPNFILAKGRSQGFASTTTNYTPYSDSLSLRLRDYRHLTSLVISNS